MQRKLAEGKGWILEGENGEMEEKEEQLSTPISEYSGLVLSVKADK